MVVHGESQWESESVVKVQWEERQMLRKLGLTSERS